MDNKQDIVKSNALIEAVYNPGSVYQMRLLMAALLQVKSKGGIDYKVRYEITANSLSDLTGSEAKNNYRELKKAADDLMNTVVHVKYTPDGEPLKRPLKINLVSSCEYSDSEGLVGLRFTDEITPYVSDLKKRFTKYQAKYVMPMKSSYGIRLYELCLQWFGDQREFEINELKEMFGLTNKYKSIKDFKLRVIDPAINDINKYSDIRVTYGQRKTGRRVSHFQFMIKKPEPKVKVLPISKWMNEYNIGKGETLKTLSKTTKEKYAKYKEDPKTWVQSELNL